MTGQVKIVTDSTAYLEPEIVKEYDIRVVPLKVAFGSQVFTEGVDITNDDFYGRLVRGNAFPTTSQPPVGDFVRVYGELIGQGHPILSMHISSRMSGTVSAARTARDTFPGAQIEIIDSLTLAMGMMVVPAAQMAERGQTVSSIKNSIEKLNTSIESIGLFDTLKYAWRGGRIGAARALLGTLLHVKPVLTFETEDVRVLAKPRTISGAKDYILKFVEKRVGREGDLHGWLAHGRIPEVASLLERELRVYFRWAELRLFELGPVFGTHMGPGFVGLGFYSDKDWHPEPGP